MGFGTVAVLVQLRQAATLSRQDPPRIRQPQLAAVPVGAGNLLLRTPHQVHSVLQVLNQVIEIEGDQHLGEA